MKTSAVVAMLLLAVLLTAVATAQQGNKADMLANLDPFSRVDQNYQEMLASLDPFSRVDRGVPSAQSDLRRVGTEMVRVIVNRDGRH